MLAGVSMTGADAVAAELPLQIEWSAQIGTPESDQSGSVAVDGWGNVYISGLTRGSLGGPNAGSSDAFLTKFNASGHVLWTRQVGTASTDPSRSVAVDGEGNAYITGTTGGSLGGPNAGFRDAFLMKFDPSGNQVWSRQIGTTATDTSNAVAVDAWDNVYISGVTDGSLGGPNAGLEDAYLVKLDASGNELWTRQIGTAEDDPSVSVAVDGAGNVFISGGTEGDLGGPNEGNHGAFLTMFDASGNELWTRQIGTTGSEGSNSVAVDGAGNAFITGNTPGSLGGPSAGSLDAYLTKFDTSGNQLWSRQIGTTADDQSQSVAVDGAGNAYISGLTSGDLGGANAGSFDAYLAKFDPNGNLLWTQQFGTADTDMSAALAVDSAGNVYSSGLTSGDLGGPNAGDFDAFLVKFAVPEPASISLLALGGLALLRRRR